MQGSRMAPEGSRQGQSDVGWRRRGRGKGSREVDPRGVEERQSMEPEELRLEQEMALPLQLMAVNTFSLEWHQSLGK